MAYNRELSQFSSLLQIDDSSKLIGIATDINVSGIVTARFYYGSGQYLTGIIGQAIPAGSAGNIQFNNGVSLGATSTFFINQTNFNVGVGTSNPTSTLTVTGSGTSTSQLYVTGVSTFIGNVSFNIANFGDNDIAYFGDSNDLAILHDGSNSLIKDVGTGNLVLAGDGAVDIYDSTITEVRARFLNNAAVELYFDNVKKFETTGAGVTITGTNFTNQLSVSGVSTFTGITTVAGNTLFASQLGISGVSTFSGGITTVTGTTLFARQFNVSGVSTLGGTTINSNTTSGNQLNFTGVSTVAGSTITSNTVSGNQLNFTGISTVAGTTINSNTTSGNQLNFTGVSTIAGSIINSNTVSGNQLNFTGVSTLGGTTINSNTTSGNQLNFTGVSTIAGSIINSNTISGNQLNLTGIITAGSASVGSAVTITSGGVNVTGVVTATSLSISNNTVSITPSQYLVGTGITLSAATGIVSATSLRPAGGTTTSAPIQFTSGANLATQTAGALEYNGVSFFATQNASTGRGMVLAPTIIRTASTITHGANATLEALFDAANDTLSLTNDTLYWFKGVLLLNKAANVTTNTLNIAFTFSNAVQSITYQYETYTTAASNTVIQRANVTVSTTTAIDPTGTTAQNYYVKLEGWFRTNATTGGTLIPQFTQTVSAQPTVSADSWLMVQPMASGNPTLLAGGWA